MKPWVTESLTADNPDRDTAIEQFKNSVSLRRQLVQALEKNRDALINELINVHSGATDVDTHYQAAVTQAALTGNIKALDTLINLLK